MSIIDFYSTKADTMDDGRSSSYSGTENEQKLIDLALNYLEDLIEYHGSVVKVADMLGTSRQAIYNWRSRKVLPQADKFQTIISLAIRTLPKHLLRGDAEMAVRETADTYGIDVEFTQAVVTQGPIYIKAVQGGKKALCRQKIPNQIPPEDTLVLYGDMVCAWSKASNTSSYVLSNIDGPEIYISTEIPEDVVLGQIVPFERRGY